MEHDAEYRQQLIEGFRESTMPLLRYLPWLEKNGGKSVSSIYSGEGIAEHSVVFPVYDGTLMSFVKMAAKSSLIDKNYKYIYTRNHIRTHADERRLIQAATWREWDQLRGILSRYVLEGRIRGNVWNEAVQEQIFYLVLKQMKEIIEYWDKPLDVR